MKSQISDIVRQTESKMNPPQLYETDFYAWAQEQVSLLKTQQWARLDTVNLVEEADFSRDIPLHVGASLKF